MARKKASEENGEETTTRTKQGFIEGMEPPSIPEIEEAAEEYVKARNKWQKAHSPMMTAQEELHEAMKRHGLRHYSFDDSEVLIVGSEKVKVKKTESEE